MSRQLEPAQVVIADGRLRRRLRGVKLRLGGDDRDQAGRRVAAEQRALRPAQHLDPVERAELGQADAGAGAIDAVDEHADRAFEAGVVADRADAADAGASKRRLRTGSRRRAATATLAASARMSVAPRIFERLGGDRADRQRHIATAPRCGASR